jgi:hypothetical protein
MIGAMQAFEPIPTRGEIFDPRIHEAVGVANTREAEDGRILQELQRGVHIGRSTCAPRGSQRDQPHGIGDDDLDRIFTKTQPASR